MSFSLPEAPSHIICDKCCDSNQHRRTGAQTLPIRCCMWPGFACASCVALYPQTPVHLRLFVYLLMFCIKQGTQTAAGTCNMRVELPMQVAFGQVVRVRATCGTDPNAQLHTTVPQTCSCLPCMHEHVPHPMMCPALQVMPQENPVPALEACQILWLCRGAFFFFGCPAVRTVPPATNPAPALITYLHYL